MTDENTTTTTTLGELSVPLSVPVSGDVAYTVDKDVIADAVANGVTALEPVELGEYGQAHLLPPGWTLETTDHRDFSEKTLPTHRSGEFRFVGVDSIARYVNRYWSDDTLGYIVDVNGMGTAPLLNDLLAARYVLNDHPTGDGVTDWRDHVAVLILRPTAAARRWGKAIGTKITQAQFLDLVVEGIGEIAEPPGADLRDLVSDLHASRSSSVKSVYRTSGALTVELADNVTLHAGPGHMVEIPERITIVLTPFAGVDAQLVVDVLVRPQVTGEQAVTFMLTAPELDAKLAEVITVVADQLGAATGIDPYWVP